jgi:hypothetical protein
MMRMVLALALVAGMVAPAAAQKFDPVKGLRVFKVSEIPIFVDRSEDVSGFDECRTTLENGIACELRATGARLTIYGNRYGNVVGIEATVPQKTAAEGIKNVRQALGAVGLESFPLEDQIARVRAAQPIENRYGALLVTIHVSREATWIQIRGPSG